MRYASYKSCTAKDDADQEFAFNDNVVLLPVCHMCNTAISRDKFDCRPGCWKIINAASIRKRG
jgi:hypothetical protein